MAKELLPDALWLRIAPLIPPEASIAKVSCRELEYQNLLSP